MIFSITDDDFLDKNKVKIIHGVAGRGKSSVINKFLQSNGIDYIWTTSTNKLKRDAEERYGCKSYTACSALFENRDGRFYLSEKDVDVSTVIIDEVLQTSNKILSWVENHVGINNIILLTDMKQMLAVDTENLSNSFLKSFEDFLQKPFVISDEGFDTKRARDLETKDKIEYLYSKSDNYSTEFKKDLRSGRFPAIRYEDMDFNTNDIFITHLNETEDKLYRDFNLNMMSFNSDEIIPKGGIASRPPKDYTKYPIISQSQAERTKSRSYYQLSNVGSCTRYQGSECTDKQKLYYIVTDDSKITNREWYTVVSRCWKLDSIVIVVADRVVKKRLESFNGKRIKDNALLSVSTKNSQTASLFVKEYENERNEIHQ